MRNNYRRMKWNKVLLWLEYKRPCLALGLCLAVLDIILHKLFIVILPICTISQLMDAIIYCLTGRSIINPCIIIHYTVICRSPYSLGISKATLKYTQSVILITLIIQEFCPPYT